MFIKDFLYRKNVYGLCEVRLLDCHYSLEEPYALLDKPSNLKFMKYMDLKIEISLKKMVEMKLITTKKGQIAIKRKIKG